MLADGSLSMAGTIAAVVTLAALALALGFSESALARQRTADDPRASSAVRDVRAFPRLAFTALWLCRDLLLVVSAAVGIMLASTPLRAAGLVAIVLAAGLVGAAVRARSERALRGRTWQLVQALLPLVAQLRRGVRFVARRLTRAPLDPFVSGEAEASSGNEDRILEPEERDLLVKVRAFGSRQVREVMTPRVEVFSLPRGVSPEELLAQVNEARFSRVPIHEGQIDHVVGILYVKDLIGRKLDEGFRLEGLLHPPTVVAPEMPIDEVFRELRRRKVHLALVIDELGTLAGLVTMEDLLEELFGEIRDESDLSAPMIERHGTALLVPGRLPVVELVTALEVRIELPEKETTVGGLLMARAGKIPRVADQITIEGLRFTVERREGTILRRVRVEPLP